MDLNAIRERLLVLGGERDVVDDFLTRMDRDYFSRYSPEEVAEHVALAACLDRDHPIALKIAPRGARAFRITVVGFDYFSEFSILCGLLTSFGLNIQSGHVHTFSDRKDAPPRPAVPPHVPPRPGLPSGLSPRKMVSVPTGNHSQKVIVDVFEVVSVEGKRFDAERQHRFEKELVSLVHLLKEGRSGEARNRVNLHLIATLSRADLPAERVLQPLRIRFDNRRSARWTILDIHGKDTPAFLYAFSNALALRGIYIHQVDIRSVGADVHDRLSVSDRRGRKIVDEKEKRGLRLSAVLIKQFTHFLVRSPDPTKAITHFDQLLDRVVEGKGSRSLIALLSRRESLDLLARLFGSSDFLWEDFLRSRFEELLPMMPMMRYGRKQPLRVGKEALRRGLVRALRSAETLENQKQVLNAYKDRELFRIDMKHLLEPPKRIGHFSSALTDLAEVVIDEAYRHIHADLVKQYGLPRLEAGHVCPFTICGLGKLGGAELGYASDIELLFVYEGPGRTDGPEQVENRVYFEKLADRIVHFIEAREKGIFHIDTRLRPYGTAGVLANPFDRFTAYYSVTGEAAPFERQALIKLRWIAGDKRLGRRVEAHRDQFVYGGIAWDLQTALELRRRQQDELVPRGKINVKYSAGGLLDIEYAVQYLQVMHGHRHPSLRTPQTLAALERLHRLKILPKEIRTDFHEGYLFLRALIDALRIVRGDAKDLILPQAESEESIFLARRMGYGHRDWEQGKKDLQKEIEDRMGRIHADFTRLFRGGK